MEGRMSETLPGQQAEKKEIFARVWKRVMADSTASCPIAWEDPAGETSTQPPVPPWESAPLRESAPLQAAGGGEGADQCPCLPAPAQPPRGHHPHSDFPHPGGVLGEGCLECAPLLQELIRRELADLREYQALARRAGGNPGRVLAGIAGEKKRRAKRLSAAYFLISGVRYWPEGQGTPPIPSYLGTLRRRFAQEQTTMAAYLAGAESTADPCLQQLFWDHARECWAQACRIRTLVEQS